MSYVGDIALGQTFDVKFTTRQISGAPFTLAGTPVISAYVGNSTTQLTAGITLTVDFDGVTGLHNVRVVATSGNGYATASDYQLVITTGTVNSVSVVGEVIGQFSIENRQSNVKFWNGTAVATPATAGIPDVNVKNIDNDAASASGTVTFPNATLASTTNITAGTITTVTTTTTATNVTTVNGLAANVITAASMAADASAEIADAVWDEDATGHQTQGTFGQAIGDPAADTNTIFKAVVTDAAGATVGVDVVAVKAETASIQTDTNDLQTQIGTAGAGLTAIDLPDQTMNITGNITGNLSGSVGTVNALAANVITAASMAADASAEIADAVWDETLAGHLGAGSTGEALNAAGAAGDPWTTTLPGAYGAGSAGFIIGTNIDAPISTVDTVVDAIKAKTDSLTFTVANKVDSNVKSVTDITVTGTGTAGDPWGP